MYVRACVCVCGVCVCEGGEFEQWSGQQYSGLASHRTVRTELVWLVGDSLPTRLLWVPLIFIDPCTSDI